MKTPAHDPAAPIAVFDSGIGGLSVWREVVRQLPAEPTLYLADQAHLPYGPRPGAEIRSFAYGIVDFFLREGAKLIVVACNTASGAALHALRAAYPQVPFVGMEPAVKPAAERTQTGAVGVLATPTTFEGDLFQQLVQRFGREVTIHTQVCPGLVEAIEAGAGDTPATRELLRGCLAPLQDAGIDQLVLGCTHYPFARGPIEALLGPAVEVIDPAPAVARQVGRVLRAQGLARSTGAPPPAHRFYTTAAPAESAAMVAALLGRRVAATGLVWEDGELRRPSRPVSSGRGAKV